MKFPPSFFKTFYQEYLLLNYQIEISPLKIIILKFYNPEK